MDSLTASSQRWCTAFIKHVLILFDHKCMKRLRTCGKSRDEWLWSGLCMAAVQIWLKRQSESGQDSSVFPAMKETQRERCSLLFSYCGALSAETRVSCYWNWGSSHTQECCSCLPLFKTPHSPLIGPSITNLAFAWLLLWWSTSLSP